MTKKAIVIIEEFVTYIESYKEEWGCTPILPVELLNHMYQYLEVECPVDEYKIIDFYIAGFTPEEVVEKMTRVTVAKVNETIRNYIGGLQSENRRLKDPNQRSDMWQSVTYAMFKNDCELSEIIEEVDKDEDTILEYLATTDLVTDKFRAYLDEVNEGILAGNSIDVVAEQVLLEKWAVSLIVCYLYIAKEREIIEWHKHYENRHGIDYNTSRDIHEQTGYSIEFIDMILESNGF